MIRRQFVKEYDITDCHLDELDDIMNVLPVKKTDGLLSRYISENKSAILGLAFFKDYNPFKFHKEKLRKIGRILQPYGMCTEVLEICYDFLEPDALKQIIVMIDFVSNFSICKNGFSPNNYVLRLFEDKIIFHHIKEYVGGKYIREYINMAKLVRKMRDICKQRSYNALSISYSLEKNRTLDTLDVTMHTTNKMTPKEMEDIRGVFSKVFADVDVSHPYGIIK